MTEPILQLYDKMRETSFAVDEYLRLRHLTSNVTTSFATFVPFCG
jgi:hypothetical protein